MAAYTVEVDGSKEFGPCECCGHSSRTVWGFVYRDGEAHAIYYVQWTEGGVGKHGAHFDLILGAFGDDSLARDRQAISLGFRNTDTGPSFMLIDAPSRPIAQNRLVGNALTREAVIGTALAQKAFNVVDAIWLQDHRIGEITGSSTRG